MTLGARVTLAAGVAVLLAVLAVSVAVYVVVRENLHAQVDRSLSHRRLGQQLFPHDLPEGSPRDPSNVPRHVPLVQDAFFQMVDRDGRIVATFDDRPLPVTPEVIAVARGERGEVFFDAEVGGMPVRVYATSTGEGTALQVGRSLAEVEQALRQLVWTLAAISLAAIGLVLCDG